ncbi:MAG: YdcF family protein [Clostridium sp.]|nr:YdcF family protein [Clostridium sp.]
MTWILEGAALLCLIYYAVITAYSGFSTSFSLFWPVMAILLTLLAVEIHIFHRKGGQIPLWLPVSIETACAACAAVFVITELCIGWGAVTAKSQAADYVIVLGAKVQGRELSSSLKARLDRAIEYTEEYPNTVLVLSGGKGEGEEISEARAMFEYLQYNGVPAERLLIEDQSCNTVENITFSRKVIERQEYYKAQAAQAHLMDQYRARSEDDMVRIGVLTSNYHVFRAKAIARKQGIWNPVGIAASADPVLALHLWIREGFAVLKDKFMGRM